MIHEKAEVHAEIPESTKVWRWAHIMEGAVIGENCSIGEGVHIADGVEIGDGTRIGDGAKIYRGALIGKNVWISQNVVFTNALKPRVEYPCEQYEITVVHDGASIGANTTIVCAHEIGEYCMIGAGSVITCDIPPYEMWYGNPAKFKGYVNKDGSVDLPRMRD